MPFWYINIYYVGNIFLYINSIKINFMETIKKSIVALIIGMFSFSALCQEQKKINTNNVQDQNETPKVWEVNQFLSELKAQELQKSNLTYSNAKWLAELLYQVQPSAYYYSNELKIVGENPTTLFTDINSLSSLNNSKTPHSIEMVRINIDNTTDLNEIIDLKLVNSFKKIKYIYIVSSIDINEATIIKMIPNLGFEYVVLYSVIKMDTINNK